jgi:phosphatase NudJ
VSDRHPTPTWYFAMVIVRLGDRFALVHERKHGQLWYFPAGRVEIGETIREAAMRETREETGLDVELTGLLRVEHSPQHDGSARCRVFFLARPLDGSSLKQEADEHSLGARWVTVEDLDQLELRGDEVRECFRAVRDGAPVAPLSMLTLEGHPW